MGNEITIGGIIVAAGIFLGLYADGGVVCNDVNEYFRSRNGAPTTETRRENEPSAERQRSRRIRAEDSIEERVINPPKEVQTHTLEIRVEDGKESAKNKCDKYSHLPDLILVSHFQSGKEASRLHCVNGKPEGEELVLYENGLPARKGNFVHGKPVGKHFEWHENGLVALERTFLHGVQVGKEFGWHANGEKAWEKNYDNGKLNGQQFKWYDNKQPEVIANYINGLREGLRAGWYQEGQKRFEENYVNGKEDGEQSKWYRSGQLASGIFFSNGNILHQERWYANGFKSDEVRYSSECGRERTCKWDEEGKITEAETCRCAHFNIMDVNTVSCFYEPDLDACGNQLGVIPRTELDYRDILLDEQTRLPASVEPFDLKDVNN
jgi:antitoxin component YwqK of YwqJK toxin-antitoxin module